MSKCDVCHKETTKENRGYLQFSASNQEDVVEEIENGFRNSLYICQACLDDPHVWKTVLGWDDAKIAINLDSQRRIRERKTCDDCFNYICLSDGEMLLLAPPETYTDYCQGCANEDMLKLSIKMYLEEYRA